MQVHRRHRTAVAIIVGALSLVLITGVANAREVQLAGMRLGQHAINLLDVYGQPMGIATGQGEEFASGAAAGGMGMGMDMLGGAMAGPGEMPGAQPAGPPFQGPGAFPGGPEDMAAAGMAGGILGAAAGGGTMEEMAAAGIAGGILGAAVGGAAAAGAGGVQRNPYPLWALPVWVTLEANEVQWLYQVGPVVLGFVLDRDGYIKSIAVAAENCNFARTALWQPHQYVKLGDNYKRVIYRYGWPDETLTYYSTGPGEVGTGGGPVSVSWGGVTREFSRDVILRYTEHNNIEFTFHNMECVRIHIWTHE